jgi:hypothetical protein
MGTKITNKADYVLILQLNDGQSVYIESGATSAAIDERLLYGNEKLAKLQSRNLVATSSEEEEEGGGAAPKAQPAAGSAEATSPGGPKGGPQA